MVASQFKITIDLCYSFHNYLVCKGRIYTDVKNFNWMFTTSLFCEP